MPDRSFEHTIGFYEVQTPNGLVVLPLITVTLVQPSGTRVDLPLMFDTGASVTTLRDDLYPLLGVPSWDSGVPLQSATAGGVAPCFETLRGGPTGTPGSGREKVGAGSEPPGHHPCPDRTAVQRRIQNTA